MPSRVLGVAGRLVKEDQLVDDNAVLVLSYPQALAVAEASWTQVGKLTSYQVVIYGTRGTLLVEPRQSGRLLLASSECPEGYAVEVPRPPAELQSASAHFLHALATGQEFLPLCADRPCRDAQEILEAGLLSARQGAEVSLPLLL
jgi:predicted dehydrogenase